MSGIGTLLRTALKESAPQVKKAGKEALEIPREVPVQKIEPVRPMQPEDVVPPKAKPEVIDEAVKTVDNEVVDPAIDKVARESLDPRKKAKPVIEQVAIPGEKAIKAKADLIDVPVEAKRTLSANLDQFDANDSWQPNFDTFETNEDVTAAIASMAERNKSSITEARRGVMKDEQLKLLAAEMNVDGQTIATVLERETGQPVNAETILASRQFLNRSGERIVALAKKVEGADATDRDKLIFRRQISLHKEVMDSFMGARAEAGRTLRAFGIKVGDDAEQLKYMNEVIDTIHGRDIDKVAKQFAHLESIEGINKTVGLFSKSKILGSLEELFINSILSGVKTHVVNITGNALFPIKGMVDTAVAARMGRFLPGDEHVMVGEAQAELYGYLSSVGDAWRMAAKSIRTGQGSDGFTKVELEYPRAISSENLEIGGSLLRIADFFNITIPKNLPKFADKATDAVGTVIRLPTERALTPMDEFFKTMARRGHVARMAFREANGMPATATNDEIAAAISKFIENPPKTVLQGADDMALYKTFQTPLGEDARKFQALTNTVPGLKFVFPFVRTPVNIFKAGLVESTPLGLFSAKIRADIAGGGAVRDMTLARIAVGSSLAGITAANVTNGFITGGGPSDYKAKAALRATGWQPYSFRVNNPITGDVEYHSYQRTEPIAYVVGAVADTVEMMQWHESNGDTESEEELEKMADQMSMAIVGGIVENTMNKTFMSGASSFVEAMNDPERYFQSYINNMKGALLPFSALRRDLTKIEDPYLRDAWEFSDKMKKQSGIPGWSEELPSKKDLYGDRINHPSGSILGVLSPFPEHKQTANKVKLEVARVMMETRTVPLTKPSKRINGVKLDVHEYDKMIRLSRKELEIGGNNFMDNLRDIMDSDIYIDATEDAKSHIIHIEQMKYDRAAKLQMMAESDSLQEKDLTRKINKSEKMLGKDASSTLFGDL